MSNKATTANKIGIVFLMQFGDKSGWVFPAAREVGCLPRLGDIVEIEKDSEFGLFQVKAVVMPLEGAPQVYVAKVCKDTVEFQRQFQAESSGEATRDRQGAHAAFRVELYAMADGGERLESWGFREYDILPRVGDSLTVAHMNTVCKLIVTEVDLSPANNETGVNAAIVGEEVDSKFHGAGFIRKVLTDATRALANPATRRTKTKASRTPIELLRPGKATKRKG